MSTLRQLAIEVLARTTHVVPGVPSHGTPAERAEQGRSNLVPGGRNGVHPVEQAKKGNYSLHNNDLGWSDERLFRCSTPKGVEHGTGPSPADIDEAEREAIAIELGGVPVIYAKAFAQIQTLPPADVPRDRWHQFVDDAGRFLDRWGGEAERTGWTADDLFGLDPVRPMARYDNMGLLWMLKGESVVELTAKAGRLSGGLTFYRKRS